MVLPAVKGSFAGINPYEVENPTPDYMRAHSIVTEGYRDNAILDTFEIRDLEWVGLREHGIRLIEETVFKETPGYLTREETERYDKAGLGELARMFAWQSPEPPVELRYFGVSAVSGYSRFFFHNPADFDGPYPNNKSVFRGVELALGFGPRGDRESTLFEQLLRRPFRVEGELRITLHRGTTRDRLNPDDLRIRETVDRVEKDVNEQIDKSKDDAEKQVNEQIEDRTGIDPKIDVDSRDIDLSDTERALNDLDIRRRAQFTAAYIQWRSLIVRGPRLFEDRLSLAHFYWNLGIGVMRTDTKVIRKDETTMVGDTAIMGRLMGEADIIRYNGDDWIVALRGGVGITAGQQGGAEAFLGLNIFHRIGE